MDDWTWKPISPICTVQERPGKDCGKPTVAGYKAMGGGYQALCKEHEKPHHKYTQTLEQIELEKPKPRPGVNRGRWTR